MWQDDLLQLLPSFWAPPDIIKYITLGMSRHEKNQFKYQLVIYKQVKNKSYLVISSRYIAEEFWSLIWLREYLVIIPENEFPNMGPAQKIRKVSTFILKWFKRKISTKFCKIVEKSHFWAIFDLSLSFLPRWSFS